MATIVVAFLAGVSLMVIFYFRLTRLGPARAPLKLVEPLGLLLKDWRAVRWVGPQGEVREKVSRFVAAAVVPTPLDDILGSPEPQTHQTLVDETSLGLLGWQRTIGDTSKEIIAIGPWPEIEPLLDLKTSDVATITKLAAKAPSEGFLSLAVAGAVHHGSSEPRLRLIGAVLLEPIVDNTVMVRLAGSQARFISALPSELIARHLNESGKHPTDWPTLAAGVPADQESVIMAAGIIGQADHHAKHQIIRVLERHGDVEFVSALPADATLPSRVQKIL